MSDDRIVHTIEKRPGEEEIRATVSEYKGRTYVGLRIYFCNGSGEWCPTKKGITIAADEIGELVTAVTALRDAVDVEPARRPDRIERYARARSGR